MITTLVDTQVYFNIHFKILNIFLNQKTISYSNPKPLIIKAPLNDAQNNESNLINQSELNDVSDHEDMRICINQRPKSGKGFGFTVRGGEERRPVVVDTVQSGK